VHIVWHAFVFVGMQNLGKHGYADEAMPHDALGNVKH
jgi:hypothetical protein